MYNANNKRPRVKNMSVSKLKKEMDKALNDFHNLPIKHDTIPSTYNNFIYDHLEIFIKTLPEIKKHLRAGIVQSRAHVSIESTQSSLQPLPCAVAPMTSLFYLNTT